LFQPFVRRLSRCSLKNRSPRLSRRCEGQDETNLNWTGSDPTSSPRPRLRDSPAQIQCPTRTRGSPAVTERRSSTRAVGFATFFVDSHVSGSLPFASREQTYYITTDVISRFFRVFATKTSYLCSRLTNRR
jgi:hypothetical protein